MKRLCVTIISLALLVFLSGCGITIHDNPNASLQVNVWVDQSPSLKVGDPLVVTVRADRDCYLSVYYLSGSGIIRQLFPDQRMVTNWVKGDIEHSIPPSDGPYRFALKSPPAQESIIAVATPGINTIAAVG